MAMRTSLWAFEKINHAVCIHKVKRGLLSLPVRNVGNIYLLRKVVYNEVVYLSKYCT